MDDQPSREGIETEKGSKSENNPAGSPERFGGLLLRPRHLDRQPMIEKKRRKPQQGIKKEGALKGDPESQSEHSAEPFWQTSRKRSHCSGKRSDKTVAGE